MFCMKCGKELPNDSMFCDGCGERIVIPEQSSQSAKSIIQSELKDSSLPKADRQRGEKLLQDVWEIQYNGATLPLSVKNITELTINMPDAKQNLPYPVFLKVKAHYDRYMMDTQKKQVNADTYYSIATSIIDSFNRIAPFELYCGDEFVEQEFLKKHYYSESDYYQGHLQESKEKETERGAIMSIVYIGAFIVLGAVIVLFF